MSSRAASSSCCAVRCARVLDLVAATLKALTYTTALSAAGLVLARFTLDRGRQVAAPNAVSRVAGLLLAVAACATAFLFIVRLGGSWDKATMDAVFLSPLGIALGVQLAGGLWVAGAVTVRAALPGALLILASFGIVGHAATRGVAASLTLVSHVAAVAWWFGGLLVLLFAMRRMTGEPFADLVGRFSRQAVWVVGFLFIAALATAALILDLRFDPDLSYDRGLLAKYGLTVALLLLAGVNKLILTPQLASDHKSVVWLHRVILTEVLLFACIIGTTAWLTTYQSPHERGHDSHEAQEHLQGNGQVGIADAWASATFSAHGTSAGYLVIINNQQVEDRLTGASSPWADHVTLHASVTQGNVASMRELTVLPIPAGGRAALTPGAYHLMLTGLYAPLVAGDVVPVTLVFEQAGEVEVKLNVRPLGGMESHDH